MSFPSHCLSRLCLLVHPVVRTYGRFPSPFSRNLNYCHTFWIPVLIPLESTPPCPLTPVLHSNNDAFICWKKCWCLPTTPKMKLKCFILAFRVFHILATASPDSIISHYLPALILCQVKLICPEQWHAAMFLNLKPAQGYLETFKKFLTIRIKRKSDKEYIESSLC